MPIAVVVGFLANLSAITPLLRDAGAVTHVDIDDTIRATARIRQTRCRVRVRTSKT